MFSAGDLVIVQNGNEEQRYGELLGVNLVTNKLEISWLKQTPQQENRIWEFVADDAWEEIDSTDIQKHVVVKDGSTRSTLVDAWKQIGFIPSGDGITFCRVEDESQTSLPLYGGDESEDEDEDEQPSINPEMHGYADDGFVVPDDEGEEFEFANPDELDEAGAKFVNETHQAVHDFDKWVPQDKQGRAIKEFVANMDQKATIQTDNARFFKGKTTLRTNKPPVPKRKRNT
tara:strand:+ start:293 stop:982 length:690 start_codon:yes stop_codon:yes gene_type:complete